jgi:hypothetical protein
LKYRLYEIDVLIGKAVVYGVLAAFMPDRQPRPLLLSVRAMM